MGLGDRRVERLPWDSLNAALTVGKAKTGQVFCADGPLIGQFDHRINASQYVSVYYKFAEIVDRLSKTFISRHCTATMTLTLPRHATAAKYHMTTTTKTK
ncbi:hypothetical protein RRG08_037883 [Elysia crispata]|uniref:Uncharacterized protein n=1 Tax=Elysia crispata TaxID=231223 RepID=A0AAE0ZKP8_9GAST|nr:hypothetical protein RRG08_037883 [Elysia crispata]